MLRYRTVVIPCRRFGTSARNYNYTLRKIPEERRYSDPIGKGNILKQFEIFQIKYRIFLNLIKPRASRNCLLINIGWVIRYLVNIYMLLVSACSLNFFWEGGSKFKLSICEIEMILARASQLRED